MRNRESRGMQHALKDTTRDLGVRHGEIIDADLESNAGVGAGKLEGFD